MLVTIPAKDVGEVKNVYRRECEVVETFDDLHERYIKKELGLV